MSCAHLAREQRQARSSPKQREAFDASRYLSISPPLAFRSSEPALNKLLVSADGRRDTELVTTTTRTRRNAPQAAAEPQRTKTRLEQSVSMPAAAAAAATAKGDSRAQSSGGGQAEATPGCRLKAQVMFESDTDTTSVATMDRSSRASGGVGGAAMTKSGAAGGKAKATRGQKELVSETQFSSSSPAVAAKPPQPAPPQQQQQNGAQLARLQPQWDYSLRVNRMRGNKVDSRVK